jgi:hypothetical protein
LRRLFAARFAGYRCRLRSGEATCSGAIAEAALVLTIAIFLADSGSRPPTGARRSVKTAVLTGRIAQAAPPYQALPWAKLSDCSKSAATGFHFRYGFKRLITDGLSRTLLGALYIKPASAWPLSLPTRGLPDLNDATGGSPTEVSLGSRAVKLSVSICPPNYLRYRTSRGAPVVPGLPEAALCGPEDVSTWCPQSCR